MLNIKIDNNFLFHPLSISPIDVKSVLPQFTPQPTPERQRPTQDDPQPSDNDSNSTLYIPTEDEIDKMERLGNCFLCYKQKASFICHSTVVT